MIESFVRRFADHNKRSFDVACYLDMISDI